MGFAIKTQKEIKRDAKKTPKNLSLVFFLMGQRKSNLLKHFLIWQIYIFVICVTFGKVFLVGNKVKFTIFQTHSFEVSRNCGITGIKYYAF
jgi:hypothetical protein